MFHRVIRWISPHAMIPAIAVCVLSIGSHAAERPPNVLMIAVDDLNDWVQPLSGHPQVQTPAMQRLADRGVVFSNAHCNSPLCNSSRTSLMLSMRPSRTGIYGLGPWFRELETLKDRQSLPQAFRQAGYRTLTAGKIYHGRLGRTDEEFDAIGPPGTPGITPPQKLVPPTPAGNNPWVDWGVFPHEESDKGDYKVASWTVDQLRTLPSNEPFLLTCGFFLPHVPCHATPKWWDLYDHDRLILPTIDVDDRKDCSPFAWYLHWRLPEPRVSWLEHHDEQRNLVHAYLSCISFTDAQLGRVLDALDASPHRDNTVICLWSDHGWHLGEKNVTGKNTLWEPSTRVPLIFAGPGIDAGRTDSPAELIDVFPTLCDLVGIEAPDDIDGESLRPQIDDPALIRSRPAITDHNPGNYGLRDQRYRLIHYADGSEELYDVIDDPEESHNRIDDVALAPALRRLRQHVPEKSAPLAPGSHSRVLEKKGDQWIWEGKAIDPDHPPMSIAPHDPSDLPRG